MPTAIIGMHRSGTSMLARLLNICGMSLGDEEQINPDLHANPKGHWEHLKFIEINERVLACFGGSSPWPQLFPSDWRERPEIGVLWNEARELIDREFAGGRAWAWKDPRTSVTLPFWQEIIPDLRYVICVRNPLDVAASLKSRDDMPIARSIALWHFYTASSFAYTEPEQRIIVHYDDLLKGDPALLGPVLAFLDMPPLEPGSEREREAASFIDTGLKHHSHGLDDVRNSPDVPDYVAELYATLLDKPEDIGRVLPLAPPRPRLCAAQQFVDAEAGRFEVRRLERAVARWSGEARRLEGEVERLEAERREAQRSVAAIQAQSSYRAACAAARISARIPGLKPLLRAGFNLVARRRAKP
jgi:hypothetical protein